MAIMETIIKFVANIEANTITCEYFNTTIDCGDHYSVNDIQDINCTNNRIIVAVDKDIFCYDLNGDIVNSTKLSSYCTIVSSVYGEDLDIIMQDLPYTILGALGFNNTIIGIVHPTNKLIKFDASGISNVDKSEIGLDDSRNDEIEIDIEILLMDRCTVKILNERYHIIHVSDEYIYFIHEDGLARSSVTNLENIEIIEKHCKDINLLEFYVVKPPQRLVQFSD
jgi:hypothetical protein